MSGMVNKDGGDDASFFGRLRLAVTPSPSGGSGGSAGAARSGGMIQGGSKRPVPGSIKISHPTGHMPPTPQQQQQQQQRAASSSSSSSSSSSTSSTMTSSLSVSRPGVDGTNGTTSSSSSSSSASASAAKKKDKSSGSAAPAVIDKTPPYRISQFENVLAAPTVDLKALRKISWNGVPDRFRPEVWQLLLGYLPVNKDRREPTIARKRKEFRDSIPLYYNLEAAEDRSTPEGVTMDQIMKDLPRTCPDTPFFHQQPVQEAMKRILFIWSIRHPASGYVQGINDLVTPVFISCIQMFVPDALRCDVAALDPVIMSNVEADVYWCLTKLLDNIQDHYTFSQPGLQRMMLRLEDLVHRLDNELHEHLVAEGVQYMHFAFRWMSCALLRELPLKVIMRLWDTYFSEEQGGFENFHVYVCVVLLKTFKEKLMGMQFQDILMFLQDPPTADWTDEEIDPILSQAYILSTLFDNSPSHLR